MKQFLIITLCLFALSPAFAETIRLSEPVTSDANSETFGVELDNTLQSIDLESLITDPTKYVGKAFIAEMPVTKVCQKKGCFFITQLEQHVIRISFKDYAFFIPTDSHGKTVTLTGKLVKKQLTTEQAAHFNADLGSDSLALNVGEVYEIVASSVKIPLS